jgi:glutaminyl-tRNA synthetase
MTDAAPSLDFIRQIVRDDQASGKHPIPLTRFPPEPNGYLHIGHAKSICLNFGIAADFGGLCNLRFDDTNPSKEDIEFVESIKADVRWLGFDWAELRHASDYFEVFYRAAEKLIQRGLAYVDSLSAEDIRAYRGTLTEAGKASPYRARSVDENLALFKQMRAGDFDDGAHVLRAKIDMAAGNINLRDPALYRIRRVSHQMTGDAWCIYPMYDFAHALSDAIEGITHSCCTLEFADHRPLYDWIVAEVALHDDPNLTEPLRAAGIAAPVSVPRQIEFSRLNLDFTVMSKRKLAALVAEGLVDGWDDPRMPTIAGLRRRGFTPESIRELARRVGVTRQDSVIELSVLENCLREDLDQRAERRLAVLKPLKLTLRNLPVDHQEKVRLPNHPLKPELGEREVTFGAAVWIEQEDFMEVPEKGFHRLTVGGEVRLRGAYIVRCVDVVRDAGGAIVELIGEIDLETRSGSANAGRKVKGTIHWVAVADAVAAEVTLYDRLFNVAAPDDGDYRTHLNPRSRETVAAQLEASLQRAAPGAHFQFERLGYFYNDRQRAAPGAPAFNRAVSLRDGWKK